MMLINLIEHTPDDIAGKPEDQSLILKSIRCHAVILHNINLHHVSYLYSGTSLHPLNLSAKI